MSLPRLPRQGVAQRAHLNGVAQRSAWNAILLSDSCTKCQDLGSVVTLRCKVRTGLQSMQAYGCWFA